MPVIDLSSATCPAVAFKPISTPGLAVTVAPGAVSKREYIGGSFNYTLAYSVGDAERRYAQAVADVLFSGARFDRPPAAGQAERGQVRANAAFQALYRHTVEGLRTAPELAQIGTR